MKYHIKLNKKKKKKSQRRRTRQGDSNGKKNDVRVKITHQEDYNNEKIEVCTQ